MARLKVLMLTRLFPSKEFPTNGTFCAERAKALSRFADLRVMVPTPYWPRLLPASQAWRRWARVERTGVTPESVPVSYPRYAVIPRCATWFQGLSMARSVRAEFRLRHQGWMPDVVDGHFAFPDGYAAARLARELGCPCLVTCHGSDLGDYPDLPLTGNMLRWTLRNAARTISVSTALRDRSIELGCRPERATHLWNGVDPQRFNMQAKEDCRRRLGLPVSGRIAVCVGRLIELKNQSLLVKALAILREQAKEVPFLALVGEGPTRRTLEDNIRRLGLGDRVLLAGQRGYDEIPLWMAAADWLVLSSKAEGWPTVYFEATACGRPVITSNVPSARDAVPDGRYGIVVDDNTPEGFAMAFVEASERAFDPEIIRTWAQDHSWSAWATSWLRIAEQVLSEKGR